MIWNRLKARVLPGLARLLETAANRVRGWAENSEPDVAVPSSDAASSNEAVIEYRVEGDEWAGPVPPKHWLELVQRHAPSLLRPPRHRARAMAPRSPGMTHAGVPAETPRTAPIANAEPVGDVMQARNQDPSGSRRGAGTTASAVSEHFAVVPRTGPAAAVDSGHTSSVTPRGKPGTGRGRGPKPVFARAEITARKKADFQGAEASPVPRVSSGTPTEPSRDARPRLDPQTRFKEASADRPFDAGRAGASQGGRTAEATDGSRSRVKRSGGQRAASAAVSASTRLRFGSDAATADHRREQRVRKPDALLYNAGVSGNLRSGNVLRPLTLAPGRTRPPVGPSPDMWPSGADERGAPGAPDRPAGTERVGGEPGGSERLPGPAAQIERRGLASDEFSEVLPLRQRGGPSQPEIAVTLPQPWPKLPDTAAVQSAFDDGDSPLWPALPGEEHLEPILSTPRNESRATVFDQRAAERIRILELEQRGIRWTG